MNDSVGHAQRILWFTATAAAAAAAASCSAVHLH